jgi:hypothetical protein
MKDHALRDINYHLYIAKDPRSIIGYNHRLWIVVNEYYRCDDGRFLVSASCMTITNTDSRSNSEAAIGFNQGRRSLETLIDLNVMKSSLVSILQRSEEKKLDNLL